MQTYLELKVPEAGHPCSSPNQPNRPNTPSIQKAPASRRTANKKQKRRNRSKQANRRQLKVRLIKKPLILSSTSTSPKPKAMTTTATVTQSITMNPIITSVMWPTAKTTKVPVSIYNVPSARIQETPNSPMPQPWPKPEGRERTPIPVNKTSPMEQQLATLIPKTTAIATLAILPVMSTPSRGPTVWPNTVLASANLFIARSWPLPPNKDNSLIPTWQKMMESNPSKTKRTQGIQLSPSQFP